jgi:hypothetical protein
LNIFIVFKVVFVGEIECAGEELGKLNAEVDVGLNAGEGAAENVEGDVGAFEEGWEDGFADREFGGVS